MPGPHDLLKWIQNKAEEFLRTSENDLGLPEPEPVFGPPLMGVAAGDDPLWEQYKGRAIGEFHWNPAEAFALGRPGEEAKAEELSVVVWVLPYTEAIRRDNRREKKYPSERWARARIFGEVGVNVGLTSFLLKELKTLDIQAVSPSLMPRWGRVDSPVYGIASNWSERHAAYAAGLGTFGLSDGLITPLGKAIRLGSLIVRHKIPATSRPYKHYREYCLFFQNGSCGVCVKRCPVGSVSFQGRDKNLCYRHLTETCAAYLLEKYGFKGYGCGLCQTAAPCEKGRP